MTEILGRAGGVRRVGVTWRWAPPDPAPASSSHRIAPPGCPVVVLEHPAETFRAFDLPTAQWTG